MTTAKQPQKVIISPVLDTQNCRERETERETERQRETERDRESKLQLTQIY